MLFSLLYLLIHRLLGVGGRRADENDIELLVLRHQVKVLQRQVKRPRLNRRDRVLLAAASRAMTKTCWSSFIVRPETLLRWHRELVKKKWMYRRMGHPGRPPVEPNVRDLIVRLSRENSRWGYQRIRGELLKLGVRVSATTGRPIVDRVPPLTGVRDPRDRLLHRRDDQMQDALRPVLHRTLDTPSQGA